jgi:hypothetical protein
MTIACSAGMLEAPDWAPHGEQVLHQLDREEGTTNPQKLEERCP